MVCLCRWPRWVAGSLAIAWLLLAASGCRPVEVVRVPFRGLAARHAGPDIVAVSEVKARGLGLTYALAPRATYDEIQAEVLAHPSPRGYLAMARTAENAGARSGLSHAEAIGWYRDSAVAATRAAADPTIAPEAIAIHNRSVAALIRKAGGPLGRGEALRESLAEAGVTVESGDGIFDPTLFDRIRVAADYRVVGIERYTIEGFGVPLIPERFMPERSQRVGLDRSYARRVIPPLTAILNTDGPLPRLVLYDPMDRSSVPLAGRPATLAADFSAPLAYQSEAMNGDVLGIAGVLNAERFDSETGVYMMHPYRPGKIPILFIHGLASSPGSWTAMYNEIRGNPELRSRYQFWFAYYPTGLPTAASAAVLRRELHELLTTIDPAGSDPALDQMVIVGHSMGGLVSRMLVQSSGDAVWNSYFSKPRSQMVLSEAARQWVDSVFYFQPVPNIKRVIFVATPHRGSQMANRIIGRVSSALTRRSARIRELRQEVADANGGPEVFQPAYRYRMLSSIDNLEWDSPMLKAMAGLPMAPGVPYHSIIGNIRHTDNVSRWSDGIVSYDSAHIDGARSEVIVPEFHTTCNTARESIEEVERLLQVHLAELPPPGSVTPRAR